MWTTKTTLSSPPFSLSENSTVLPLINISTCTCIYVQTWKRERVQVGVFQDLFVSCKSRESSLELKIIVQLESFFFKKNHWWFDLQEAKLRFLFISASGYVYFPFLLNGFSFFNIFLATASHVYTTWLPLLLYI